jgi:hypothetical protein
MAIFEEVRLEWGGKEHVIPPDRIMGAIAVVEELVTFVELSHELQTRQFRLGRLAQAYAALLGYAGAKVSTEEVYAALFRRDGADETLRAASAVVTLLMIMVPPAAREKATAPAEEAGAPAGKPESPSAS